MRAVRALRAMRAVLPKHLRLGVTLAGMRELLSQLPSDAVEQVNANIPRDKVTGKPKYPENDVENGYVNQFHVTLREREDTLTVCERLQAQGSPHVGKANVFVSWFLDTSIATLLDALANFLKEKGLREEDTFFWVCDNVIRQTNVGPDLALLGDCVSAIGHTVLLLEPWNDPQPLKRAYCIKEVCYTQVSGATFDMVMSTEQQQSFERALATTYGDDNFASIEASLSRVDVRQADCRNAKDKADILDELEKGVGFDKCNTLVVGLLREALVAQGRAALGRLSAGRAERSGATVLLVSMCQLLSNMGKPEEAGQLHEEARATLGDRGTLSSMRLEAMRLLKRGRLAHEEARALYEEALQEYREALGDRHPDTLEVILHLAKLLYHMGRLEEARPLFEEVLQGRRATLGDRDPKTLFAIYDLAELLEEQGKLVEATPLYTEVLQGRRETLGDHDLLTIRTIHSQAMLLEKQGKLVEAIPLYTEELEGRVLRYGMEHARYWAKNLVSKLREVGQREEAEALADKHGLAEHDARQLKEALEELQEMRETEGDRDPHTLDSIYALAGLLVNQGKLVEAIPLYTEALEGYVLLYGMEHAQTRSVAERLVSTLREAGQQEEAEALAAKHGFG